MLLGILKETAPGETRVALLPESLKGLLAQGITVVVESGAGNTAGASDEAYTAAGASVTGDRPSMPHVIGKDEGSRGRIPHI